MKAAHTHLASHEELVAFGRVLQEGFRLTWEQLDRIERKLERMEETMTPTEPETTETPERDRPERDHEDPEPETGGGDTTPIEPDDGAGEKI